MPDSEVSLHPGLTVDTLNEAPMPDVEFDATAERQRLDRIFYENGYTTRNEVRASQGMDPERQIGSGLTYPTQRISDTPRISDMNYVFPIEDVVIDGTPATALYTAAEKEIPPGTVVQIVSDGSSAVAHVRQVDGTSIQFTVRNISVRHDSRLVDLQRGIRNVDLGRRSIRGTMQMTSFGRDFFSSMMQPEAPIAPAVAVKRKRQRQPKPEILDFEDRDW